MPLPAGQPRELRDTRPAKLRQPGDSGYGLYQRESLLRLLRLRSVAMARISPGLGHWFPMWEPAPERKGTAVSNEGHDGSCGPSRKAARLNRRSLNLIVQALAQLIIAILVWWSHQGWRL